MTEMELPKGFWLFHVYCFKSVSEFKKKKPWHIRHDCAYKHLAIMIVIMTVCWSHSFIRPSGQM